MQSIEKIKKEIPIIKEEANARDPKELTEISNEIYKNNVNLQKTR